MKKLLKITPIIIPIIILSFLYYQSKKPNTTEVLKNKEKVEKELGFTLKHPQFVPPDFSVSSDYAIVQDQDWLIGERVARFSFSNNHNPPRFMTFYEFQPLGENYFQNYIENNVESTTNHKLSRYSLENIDSEIYIFDLTLPKSNDLFTLTFFDDGILFKIHSVGLSEEQLLNVVRSI